MRWDELELGHGKMATCVATSVWRHGQHGVCGLSLEACTPDCRHRKARASEMCYSVACVCVWATARGNGESGANHLVWWRI